MNGRLKKLVGVLLISLGLFILVTPFTPGSILLIIGMDLVFGDNFKKWSQIRNKVLGFFSK